MPDYEDESETMTDQDSEIGLEVEELEVNPEVITESELIPETVTEDSEEWQQTEQEISQTSLEQEQLVQEQAQTLLAAESTTAQDETRDLIRQILSQMETLTAQQNQMATLLQASVLSEPSSETPPITVQIGTPEVTPEPAPAPEPPAKRQRRRSAAILKRKAR